MQKKILVCDDDPHIREVAQLILQKEGYYVKTLMDGYNIIDRVESFKPDLLLLDVMMPGENGRDITQLLKKNKATESLPVILFTALPAPEKICTESGADGYIAKPFVVNEFLIKVECCLRQHEAKPSY